MTPSPRIIGLSTAVPEARWRQEEILEHFARHFPAYRNPRIQQIFLNSGIDSRHLAMPPDVFLPDNSPNQLHAVYKQSAIQLGAKAIGSVLSQAGLEAGDIGLIVAATCTGYLCPGLSARLAAEAGMQPNLQRADLVGMGCAGAMPALQRAHDFVRAYPARRALVVAVEVSSACWFVDDTLETVVGNAICADGAAAAIVAATGNGPAIERFETVVNPSYLESVGFAFQNGKNRIVLDAQLRHGAGPMVREAVELLRGPDPEPVDHWIVHAGGRKVLEGIHGSLRFRNGELRHSWDILRTHGNMSSPTVLFVLERTMAEAQPGATGVMAALGPGLAAETALLRW